nr:MAG TPA: hypothetical protein [Caudoviricetes sp.]
MLLAPSFCLTAQNCAVKKRPEQIAPAFAILLRLRCPAPSGL